jgi:hypothetical protein|nr:MAG TPA: hypothetical protein [Caudoviricetes sp.]
MAGKTEEALSARMEQVNKLIDKSYADMEEYARRAETDDDDREYNMSMAVNAQRSYVSFMNLLMTMTKNFDEAVKVDSHKSKATATKTPKTTLQKLVAKEAKRS